MMRLGIFQGRILGRVSPGTVDLVSAQEDSKFL